MTDNSRAYNSVWQLRGDAWCRLEEAADRLTKPTTSGELREEYVAICKDLLATLTPLEPYWAYPGTPQFSRVARLFSAGSYDTFAHAVARINRALTTESYRSGDVEHAGLEENDVFPRRPAPAGAPAGDEARPAVLRGARRGVDDLGAGTRAAQPVRAAGARPDGPLRLAT